MNWLISPRSPLPALATANSIPPYSRSKRGTLEHGYNVSPGGSVGTPEDIVVAGVKYASHSAAAEHYGVPVKKFSLRITRLGWTPEEAAEIGSRHEKSITVAGMEFSSLHKAARHFGKNYQLVYNRIYKNGWTAEQALGLEPTPDTVKYQGVAVGAFGKSFDSLAACARHFGIKPETLRHRVRNLHQDVEGAVRELGRFPKPGAQGKEVMVFGKRFRSVVKCAKHYGVSVHSLRNRLRYQGDSVEDAVKYLQSLRK